MTRIDALFPARADPDRIDPNAIAAWIAFRQHLADALRTGAQNANGEHSLVHLLDVGAFLVWPQAALSFADERRIAPNAIKSAMRAACVLAVNRADRQEDRHAFPVLSPATRTSPATASSPSPSTSGRTRPAGPPSHRRSSARPPSTGNATAVRTDFAPVRAAIRGRAHVGVIA